MIAALDHPAYTFTGESKFQEKPKLVAKIISVFNQKGGCGKTTITMHIAGTLALRNFRVLVADLDLQGTAQRWASCAEDSAPFPASVISLANAGRNVHREIRNHINDYDYIVVDCPPAIDTAAPSSALLVSDLALVPFVPSPADLWALIGADKLYAAATFTNTSLKGALIANMVKRQAIGYEVIQEVSKTASMQLMNTRIGDRAAFRECQVMGSTVHSVPRAKDAVREVEALTDEVLKFLVDSKQELK